MVCPKEFTPWSVPVGCGPERQPPADTPARPTGLSADAAKQALLGIAIASVPHLIPGPRDEPIQQISADEIEIGCWKCNLREETFRAAAYFPEALRHRHNEVEGVFEQGPDGKWTARVTRARG